MIVSIVLSGGISSTIAGGNFWQGAAIGFTVGLLNHSAHAFVTRYKIDGYLKQKGVNPTDPVAAEHRTKDGIRQFINMITPLGFDYINAGEPMIIVSDKKYGDLNPVSKSLAYYTPSTHDITVFQQLFSTNYRFFALTLGHEIQHALHHYSGIYSNWVKNHSNKWAEFETEMRAYKWQIDYSSNAIRSPWNGPYSLYPFARLRDKYKLAQSSIK